MLVCNSCQPHIDVVCFFVFKKEKRVTSSTKANGIEHQKLIANKGKRVKDKIYHVQNVNNTASRLRKWMKPFNGVEKWFELDEKIFKTKPQDFKNKVLYLKPKQVEKRTTL